MKGKKNFRKLKRELFISTREDSKSTLRKLFERAWKTP